MRIRRMTTVLLLTAALTGCAEMTATPDVTAATSEAAGDEAIAEATPLPIGNYLAARFAASEHDMPEAAKYYRAALNEDPGNTDLLSSAFIYSAYAGDVDGAARLAQQIITASPSDRTARLVLSLAAFKRRNFTEARKQLSLAQPGSFMALTGALIDGWAAVGLRDATAAETNMKTLAAQNGGSPMSALHRALMLDAMGRTGTEMNDAYLQALAQNPANSRLIDAYGRYLEREGRGQEAAALYTRLGNNAGITPIAAAGRARVAAGRKPDKLVRNAEDGVAEALAGIASALSDPDSVDASMFYLRLALYLRPDHDFASIILGARFETLKKYEDANVAYGRIRKESPFYRMAAIEIAMNESRLERPDIAIAKLKTLAEANPADIEIWTSLGDAYRSTERYAEASTAYDHAIAQLGTARPNNWVLYYSRAMARERNKKWPEAEADLKKALELSPNEPQVMNYLGYSWIEQGQNLTEAVVMLERARSLRPQDGYIVDSVGWAYYQLGRYEDAARTLQDAVQLVPGDPTVNDHLGDAFWRIGRKLDARFQWNHALTFDPTPEERADIEKKLQSGLGAADQRG